MQHNKIRRKDRAVNDYEQMLEIMRQCDVCRLGFQEEQGVYILPLNFAFKQFDDRLELYFHGHQKGKKIDLIKQQKIVGFQMDRKHELVTAEIACHYSFRYQSIIGKGEISLIEERSEKITILQYLMEHYTGKSDWQFEENELNRIAVMKLIVTEWACKEH
ncbi:pyridoxamine 5'-phosphate oxidase family protein [Actinobacillus equuli]|uniref:5-nitroimidazole antibiotic resistance protein n=1 Tax=Actinobacillus equuli TaxID=718 RepID=A0AAX3FJD0_ACTEU|nr:pyridoxamine 5'-phosphate oxidase family protein [Actinobacillus equuli]MDG4953335.1 pyridoxamine 5'-phosphate oxidase family protein [Actinobacillus equuli subsp. equuli]WGE41828.1 pyridoxamine 5'-phosphate oxidase family protein [Actinobacillus equuli subsp. haemolyticus]WGE44209.1 pyridoxamine 5'-phosphate oxidase family protein [Actinobacillus equuli subsp. equuli]WGE56911.1 pyridoxamine 5'-phosphate oxidase family protein [Actinobacillus equuli subsp. equuli]WGE75043.1 pyridoxamine 5'-